MYKVIGESIKSAISVKLGEIFGKDAIRYKEAITDIQYPNFFIYQVSVSSDKVSNKIRNLNYLINIRYRYVEDINTVTDLEQKLDEVGFMLATEFTDIKLDRIKRVTNARYEKVDGVLQFFCNLNIRVTEEAEEEVKMQYLDLLEKLKKEEN